MTKTIKEDSFFNFFSPPLMPDNDEECDSEMEAMLTTDFEVQYTTSEVQYTTAHHWLWGTISIIQFQYARKNSPWGTGALPLLYSHSYTGTMNGTYSRSPYVILQTSLNKLWTIFTRFLPKLTGIDKLLYFEVQYTKLQISGSERGCRSLNKRRASNY